VVQIDGEGYEITKKEKYYFPKEVKLDKLKLIPVLLLDNVSVVLMFYYNKLLNLLKKSKQIVLKNKRIKSS